jgi:hypothetical protein
VEPTPFQSHEIGMLLGYHSRKHSYNESVLGLRQPNYYNTNFGMLWSTQVKQEITRVLCGLARK